MHVLLPQDQNVQYFFSACSLLLRNSEETMAMVRLFSVVRLCVFLQNFSDIFFRCRVWIDIFPAVGLVVSFALCNRCTKVSIHSVFIPP